MMQISPMDAAWLFVSSLFSLVGAVALLYGWRQRLGVPTLIGLMLSIYPYFVSNVVAMIGIGLVLLGALFIGLRMEQNL
jgi:hypothetical protein